MDDDHYCPRRSPCRLCRVRMDSMKVKAASNGYNFWNSKIFPGTKWDLGPSSPDAWIQTHVVNGGA